MYSKEQREKALALYDKCQSVTKAIQLLGYPESRQGLYLWLRNVSPKKKAERSILRCCFIEGKNVQLVSEERCWKRNLR